MELRLNVTHYGQAKMVGVCFETGGKRIMLHQASSSNWHYGYDSPGGVDACVLKWLLAEGILEVHHHDYQRGMLYVAPVHTIIAHGIRLISGGRDRLYLPQERWVKIKAPVGGLPYEVPYAREQHTLDGYIDPRANSFKQPGVKQPPLIEF